MRSVFEKAGIFVVIVAGIAGSLAMAPVRNRLDRDETEYSGLDAHESSATVSLLGQFRTNLTAWLWLRTDLYLHNGVEMRPMLESELKTRSEATSADGLDEEMHDEPETTVVPPKEADFRGILGDIERQTATYRDMHNHVHNSPKQSLPLFRLMTWLDPKFIQGWTVGSTIMAFGKENAQKTQATEFLKEGLKNNPQNIILGMELGEAYLRYGKDSNNARKQLSQALTWAKSKDLSEDELDAVQNGYRWLALVERDFGTPINFHAVVVQGLEHFPDDTVLKRLLNENSRSSITSDEVSTSDEP